MIRAINPTDGEPIAEYQELDDQGIERAIAAAAARFTSYRSTSLEERAGWMRRAAELLQVNHLLERRLVR